MKKYTYKEYLYTSNPSYEELEEAKNKLLEKGCLLKTITLETNIEYEGETYFANLILTGKNY